MKGDLGPTQFGFGTRGGNEAMAHPTRKYIDEHPDSLSKIFIKLDFKNAFDMLDRNVMQHEVKDTLPSLHPFISQCSLSFGEHFIGSQTEEGEAFTTLVRTFFSSKMLTVPRCLIRGTDSDRVNLFRELQLSFPNTNYNENQTVQSLLDYYFEPEELTEDNQCYCKLCSPLTVREEITKIMEAPPRLISTLKLFRYDLSSHQSIKMQHFVCLDEHLIIDSWIYQLHAVVIHCGSSVDSGHYFIISKDNNDKEIELKKERNRYSDVDTDVNEKLSENSLAYFKWSRAID
ncbi:unnamed protein product [Phaedon cochleariae]|uniref:USP domain-containing protein n=1 Tax=Phaedon cochleariae TaxID=80249 RepID=A0A9N9SD95_PHACE|nr:unnamed protein product [Phaedon cochleariae]